MKSTKLVFVVLAALALLFTAYGQASAQAPAAAPKAEQAAPSAPAAPSAAAAGQAAPAVAVISADGELTEVDVKGNMLTVKTSTGAEMKFKYTDSVKITGGQKGVAGLATMTGSQVTIQYTKDGATNNATSITVKPAAGAARPAEQPRSPAPESPRPERPEQPRQ